MEIPRTNSPLRTVDPFLMSSRLKSVLAISFFIGTCLASSILAEMPATGRQGAAPALQPFVDDNEIAGFITVVSDAQGPRDITVLGMADREKQIPMREDALFWIASMSKPITAVGVLLLVDEGKLKLDDPVEKYIPDFKDQMVIKEKSPDHIVLEKPVRPITIADCLSHTAGLPFKSLIEQPTLDMLPLRIAVLSHAAAPLLHQPGSKYLYSNAGINTAGRIIEIVSGMDYESFMQQRLFAPLGMKDTTSFPSASQVARLARAYKANADKTSLEPTDVSQLFYPLTSQLRHPMPGGGYFSTAADVSAFGRMLLNGGLHAGKRILSDAAVQQLRSRHTPASLNADYGLGVKREADGSYGHDGAYSTNLTIDPTGGRVLVYMVQVAGYRTDKGRSALAAFKRTAATIKGTPVK